MLLRLSSESSSFKEVFEGQLRHNSAKGRPNSKAPPNAVFFSLFLENALLLSFVVLRYPKILCAPEKEEKREKMATSSGVDRHFHGPG